MRQLGDFVVAKDRNAVFISSVPVCLSGMQLSPFGVFQSLPGMLLPGLVILFLMSFRRATMRVGGNIVPRALQVDQALACINLAECAGGLVAPLVEATTPVERERLFHREHFWLSRLHGDTPFAVGMPGVPSVLVCIAGTGQMERGGATYTVRKGDVFLLPAETGTCTFRPRGVVSVLEIETPE